MPNNLSSKKTRQINKSKQKTTIRETSPRTTTISCLDNSDKKKLSIPIVVIKTSEPKTKNIDIAMIDADAYYLACYLKKA